MTDPTGAPTRVVWDGRISLGTVVAAVQLICVIAGGLYALAEMNAQINAVKSELQEVKADLKAELTAIRSDQNATTNRMERRMDNLNDRVTH